MRAIFPDRLRYDPPVFYVYVVFDFAGVPRYVGKGTGSRFINHAKSSNHPQLRLLSAQAGKALPVIRIQENITNEAALVIEKALIVAIGMKSAGGPLFNKRKGGYGPGVIFGRKLPSTHRAAIANTLRGRTDNNEPGRIASPIAKRGQPLDRAIVEKMRQSKTGVKQSEAHRKALGDARRGKPLSEAHRAAISRGNKGISKPTSMEARARIAATMSKKLWWFTIEGEVYRAEEQRNPSDKRGRKPR